jgi:hypothetical protein
MGILRQHSRLRVLHPVGHRLSKRRRNQSASYEYLKEAPKLIYSEAVAPVPEPAPAFSGPAGRSPWQSVGSLMRLCEEPFLQAEMHKVEILLKKV